MEILLKSIGKMLVFVFNMGMLVAFAIVALILMAAYCIHLSKINLELRKHGREKTELIKDATIRQREADKVAETEKRNAKLAKEQKEAVEKRLIDSTRVLAATRAAFKEEKQAKEQLALCYASEKSWHSYHISLWQNTQGALKRQEAEIAKLTPLAERTLRAERKTVIVTGIFSALQLIILMANLLYLRKKHQKKTRILLQPLHVSRKRKTLWPA